MLKRAWHNDKFRYLAIGGYNTIVGYGVFAVLWIFWGHTLHYITALVISHIISVINAFYAYRVLVFRKKGDVWNDFVKFNMVYLGAFLFNLLALPVLIEGANLQPLLAQALLVILTVLASYILHRRFTFRLD
ncbi:MAG: GtrA family protein [Gallionella sp.]|nr:GtrA family protein [Gallionella sp.]